MLKKATENENVKRQEAANRKELRIQKGEEIIPLKQFLGIYGSSLEIKKIEYKILARYKHVAEKCNIKEKKLIPVTRSPVSSSEKLGYQSSRYQFPVVPAEPLTIHKSQGNGLFGEHFVIDSYEIREFQTRQVVLLIMIQQMNPKLITVSNLLIILQVNMIRKILPCLCEDIVTL